jgi:hypothetical protein
LIHTAIGNLLPFPLSTERRFVKQKRARIHSLALNRWVGAWWQEVHPVVKNEAFVLATISILSHNIPRHLLP